MRHVRCLFRSDEDDEMEKLCFIVVAKLMVYVR